MVSRLITWLKFIYFALYLGLLRCVAAFFQPGISIWARNSFILGYFSRHSDLDLTFFGDFKGEYSSFLFKSLLKFHIGEINYYKEEDKRWAKLANPIELERDPNLEKRWGIQSPHWTKAQVLVFLLRMAGSDVFLQDERKAEARKKKWEFHMGRINRHFPDQNLDLKEFNLLAVKKYIAAFLPSDAPKDLLELAECTDSEWARVLAPHRWLVFFRTVRPELPSSCFLGGLGQEIQAEQIKWEMWGLLGQFRSSEEIDNTLEHLQHLFEHLPIELYRSLGCKDYLEYLRAEHSLIWNKGNGDCSEVVGIYTRS